MEDEITLTIDEKEAKGKKGDTILEVCKKNDIDVPTLCHFEGLTNRGACRMCIVEIEGGRGYPPACTMPAADGMVVFTETEEIAVLRKSNLELLFSERNHYCMFCEVSGDCELQALAYRYGIEFVHYEQAYPKLSVDTSRPYFLFDQNRCVLCRRCVRSCAELAGHNVLGVRERGWETMISADLDTPFGESTCVSCGTCMQTCPTGALIDRKSAYLGTEVQLEETKTTCIACSVGCGMKVFTRDNHIVRIEGDWDAPVNGGVLCVAGRFEQIYDEKERILHPLVKRDGKFEEVDWDEALNLVASKIEKVGDAAAVASARSTNEELYAFKKLFSEQKKKGLLSLFGRKEFIDLSVLNDSIINVGFEDKGRLADVANADCIVLVKVDLTEEQQVVSSFVKRAAAQGAELIIVDDGENGFDTQATQPKGLAPYASTLLQPSELSKVNVALSKADCPAVIYGMELGEELTNSMRQLALAQSMRSAANGAILIGLVDKANSRGAAKLGFDTQATQPKGFNGERGKAKVIYMMACDDDLTEENAQMLKDAEFSVVQASYFSPAAEAADVLLPSPMWAEKSGSITNTEGITQKITNCIEKPGGIKTDWEIIAALSAKLGGSMKYDSVDDISAEMNKDD